ncbi:hypothetical protein FOCC_FOCC012634 [Frankliniella occidentalis]|nr:hypothetical protein FOCC_FOCC012634 [Frankliniella occidentalis]
MFSQGRKLLRELARQARGRSPSPVNDLAALFTRSEAAVLSVDFLKEINNNQQQEPGEELDEQLDGQPEEQPDEQCDESELFDEHDQPDQQRVVSSPSLTVESTPGSSHSTPYRSNNADSRKISPASNMVYTSAKAVQGVKVRLFKSPEPKEKIASYVENSDQIHRLGQNLKETFQLEGDQAGFDNLTPLLCMNQYAIPEVSPQFPVPELTPLQNVSTMPLNDISGPTVTAVVSNTPGNNIKQGTNVKKALFLQPPSDGLEKDSLLIQEVEDTVPDIDFLDVTSEPEEPVQTVNNKRKRKSNISEKTPPKKRCTRKINWKSTKAKIAYNSGVEHVSLRGKEVKARELKAACQASCRKKCYMKMTDEHRLSIFKKYYGTQNKTLQWNMINKLVRTVGIKQRTTENENRVKPYRMHSYQYFLHDPDGNLIPVCQTMFLNTLDISSTVVHTAVNKNSPDKRGTHPKTKKRLSPELIQNVKNHIKEFPTVESHYCREDSRRKYLDENLSISKMHRLYLLERGELPNTATRRQYRDIFNTCFNLSFFKPKKDQCAQCVQWERSTPEEKETISQKYQVHVESKNTVRQLKKSDKENSINGAPDKNVRVLTFDLQKVLYSPKSEVGEFFYKRKLSSYNFTIYDCTTGQAYCFVWDQTIAKRGSDEISSCVLSFFEEAVKNGVTEFKIYSDSCSGQNKNKFLYSMYYLAARKYNVKIIHRYLEKGHTQMECDSVHAQIEKKTRNMQIFTPAQWYGYMKSAKVQKPAYIVKEIDQKTIFSFKDIAEHLLWAKIPISKIREITIDSLNPDVATYKLEFGDACTSKEILQKKRGRPVNWSTLQLHPAYKEPLPLKPKLVKDLKWYVQKDLIPTAFIPYYNKLTSQTVSEDDDEEDDVPQEIEQQRELLEEDEEEDDEEESDI